MVRGIGADKGEGGGIHHEGTEVTKGGVTMPCCGAVHVRRFVEVGGKASPTGAQAEVGVRDGQIHPPVHHLRR